MRKILNHSEFVMAIIGGILYDIIFITIISRSFYQPWAKTILALFTCFLGPTILCLVDCLIQIIVDEIFDNGLKEACILFLYMHVIWLPLILATIILYVMCSSLSFMVAIKSPKLIISVILLILWIIEVYFMSGKTRTQ